MFRTIRSHQGVLSLCAVVVGGLGEMLFLLVVGLLGSVAFCCRQRLDLGEPVADTGVGSVDRNVVEFGTFVFSCRAVCVSFLFLCLAFLFLKIGQGLLKKILHFPFQQLPGLPWEVVDYLVLC